MNELCKLSGTEQARLVLEREVSPVELTEAVLDHIEGLDAKIQAFCTLDREGALEQARRAEEAVTAGEALGPLHGVPVSVKDLISTAGLRTTYGSRVYADLVPEEDDIVVERVRDAGGVIIGKTNAPEFGYQAVCNSPLFGVTNNPWRLDTTTGGSSGGSGAAIATGMGAFTLGSDGGGSLRIPSSLCGIYTIKATFGRVPVYPSARDPELPGGSSWETLDHVGPMTRTVADSATLLSVIAGYDHRDRHALPGGPFDYAAGLDSAGLDRGLTGRRIAWTPDWGWASVDPRVREITEKAVRVFEEELGCEVVEEHPDFKYTQDDFWSLVAGDADLAGLRELVAQRGHEMSDSVVELANTPWTAEDLTNAVKERQRVTNKLWRFFERYDLFLTPTLAVPAFEHGILGPAEIDGNPVKANAWIAFTHPFNLTGQPAASVPAGWTADGLPVGLQIVGRRLDDALVLQASAAFERARPWAQRWPAIVEEELV